MNSPGLVLVLAACSSGTSRIADEDSGPRVLDPYEAGHLLEVEVTLDPDDWARLRAQSRDVESMFEGAECMDEPFGSPFTWFEGEVVLDGEVLERVDVRKKGFLGSLTPFRPSLKLDLGEYDATAAYRGQRRLTLNNARSDPAIVRQCLTYLAFESAGLAAPRCSLAHVTVNEEDLGVYVNVEPMKEPLLERAFGSAEGALFEGTLSDFREGWSGTFEPKTPAAEGSRAAIDAVEEAAASPDDELLSSLDAVMDLDQFFRFWALEIVTQHGDGYTGNHNNFYVYADPSDSRLRFVPWGTDMTFGVWEAAHAAERGEPLPPPDLLATSLLPWRLANLSEGRARLETAMLSVLEESWDEELMLDTIDLLAETMMPAIDADRLDARQEALTDLRARVSSRRGELFDALERGLPEADVPPPGPYCWERYGTADVSFSTTWQSLSTEEIFSYGASQFELELKGGETISVSGTSVAGQEEGQTRILSPAWISPWEAYLLAVIFPEPRPVVGTFPVGYDLPFAGLFYVDTRTMDDFELQAYVVGQIEFTRAESEAGGVVVGRVSGEFLER